MRLKGSVGLGVILAVALIVRVGVIVASPDFQPIFDAADFDRHADSIADGHWYPPPQLGVDGPTAFRPPLYPAALAVVQAVGGAWTAERLLSALLGVLTVLLVYLIARRLWGQRVATVAGAIAAVFPPLVMFSATILSEALFLPLVLGAVLAVLYFRDTQRMRWVVAAGVLCGLAVLTRANGLPLVLALAVGVWTSRPLLSRRALVAPAVVVLATALTIVPWVIRNAIEFDRYVGITTSGGFALAGTYNAEARSEAEHPGQPVSPNQLDTYQDELTRRDLDEDEMIGLLNDQATDYIRDHPGYVAQTFLWNIPRLLDIERSDSFEKTFATSQLQAIGVEKIDSAVVFLGSLYVVLLTALAGAALQITGRGPRRAPLFVWLVPLSLVVLALAIYGLPRYRAPADPFLILLASVAVVWAFDSARGQSGSSRERTVSNSSSAAS